MAFTLERAYSQSMLVHGRGSYPRIGWFDSIDCDHEVAPRTQCFWEAVRLAKEITFES